MLTTTAEITSIDLNSNDCFVRVPLFENLDIGSQAIMKAKIAVQPGSFNNYSVNDIVWIIFIEGRMDIALVIGKVYKSAVDEAKNSSGVLNLNSLRVHGGTAELPAMTSFNVASESYNSIEKLINKIKDLEIQNITLLDTINNLQTQINNINGVIGENVVMDVEGNILSDSEGEVLQYASNE